VLTLALLWLGARLDILTMLGGTALDRAQLAARGMLGDAVAAMLGDPAAGLLGSTTGVALLATTFVIGLIVAAAGLRAVAASSRRSRQ